MDHWAFMYMSGARVDVLVHIVALEAHITLGKSDLLVGERCEFDHFSMGSTYVPSRFLP